MLSSKGHVKLVDFGFAKILQPPLYETASLCGTPEYLAPEIIQPVQSSGCYTRAVDWWSFGVLIYEMIAGHPPFFVDPPSDCDENDADEGEVPIELYRKILDGKVGYPPWMSPLAKDLIRRLLIVDPSRRLGAVHGEIEAHQWFDNVNWDLVIRGEWELSPAVDFGLIRSNLNEGDEIDVTKEVRVFALSVSSLLIIS
jgi:serine/threonine protein kinase